MTQREKEVSFRILAVCWRLRAAPAGANVRRLVRDDPRARYTIQGYGAWITDRGDLIQAASPMSHHDIARRYFETSGIIFGPSTLSPTQTALQRGWIRVVAEDYGRALNVEAEPGVRQRALDTLELLLFVNKPRSILVELGRWGGKSKRTSDIEDALEVLRRSASVGKSAGIDGEWWIDDIGIETYADGDVGDQNHESVAFWSALEVDYEDAATPEGLAPGEPFTPEVEAWLRERHAPEDAIQFLKGGKDARKYMVVHKGWIRVKRDNFEVWTFDDGALARIRNFVYDNFDPDDENLEDSDGDIAVDELSTGRWYTVPVGSLVKGNLSAELLKTRKRVGSVRQALLMQPPPKMLDEIAEWVYAVFVNEWLSRFHNTQSPRYKYQISDKGLAKIRKMQDEAERMVSYHGDTSQPYRRFPIDLADWKYQSAVDVAQVREAFPYLDVYVDFAPGNEDQAQYWSPWNTKRTMVDDVPQISIAAYPDLDLLVDRDLRQDVRESVAHELTHLAQDMLDTAKGIDTPARTAPAGKGNESEPTHVLERWEFDTDVQDISHYVNRLILHIPKKDRRDFLDWITYATHGTKRQELARKFRKLPAYVGNPFSVLRLQKHRDLWEHAVKELTKPLLTKGLL